MLNEVRRMVIKKLQDDPYITGIISENVNSRITSIKPPKNREDLLPCIIITTPTSEEENRYFENPVIDINIYSKGGEPDLLDKLYKPYEREYSQKGIYHLLRHDGIFGSEDISVISCVPKFRRHLIDPETNWNRMYIKFEARVTR